MRKKIGKLDWYIAFPDADRIESQIWDMMRYDRCYPHTFNAAPGWVVLKQPYLEGVSGGFTLKRWESFGIRNPVVVSAYPGYGSPFELADLIRQSAKQVSRLAVRTLPHVIAVNMEFATPHSSGEVFHKRLVGEHEYLCCHAVSSDDTFSTDCAADACIVEEAEVDEGIVKWARNIWPEVKLA